MTTKKRPREEEAEEITPPRVNLGTMLDDPLVCILITTASPWSVSQFASVCRRFAALVRERAYAIYYGLVVQIVPMDPEDEIWPACCELNKVRSAEDAVRALQTFILKMLYAGGHVAEFVADETSLPRNLQLNEAPLEVTKNFLVDRFQGRDSCTAPFFVVTYRSEDRSREYARFIAVVTAYKECLTTCLTLASCDERLVPAPVREQVQVSAEGPSDLMHQYIFWADPFAVVEVRALTRAIAQLVYEEKGQVGMCYNPMKMGAFVVYE